MGGKDRREIAGGGQISAEEIDILYEDNHLIVVDKPAPLLTQGDASGRDSLDRRIKNHIKRRDGKPGKVFLGIVQRLDRPVSGVIVFAKTSKAARRLSAQIREHRLGKWYLAVTAPPGSQRPENGGSPARWRTLRHRLRRSGDLTVVSRPPEHSGQLAELRVRSLYATPGHAVHLVRLITGRKHQIRAQLAEAGTPVCGDRKYGSTMTMGDGAIALHACQLTLTHPTRETPISLASFPCAPFWAPFPGIDPGQVQRRLKAALSES